MLYKADGTFSVIQSSLNVHCFAVKLLRYSVREVVVAFRTAYELLNRFVKMSLIYTARWLQAINLVTILKGASLYVFFWLLNRTLILCTTEQ